MAADLILTNDGVKYASGNIIDIKTAVPSSGTYTTGDIVIESSTGVRVSGWKRLTTGSGHVLNTDWAYFSAAPVSGTAVATTSGTSIGFTGIPSWVKRITVAFNGVSTNGTSAVQLQLGDAGGFETSGYTGTTGYNSSYTNYSSGFAFDTASSVGATALRYGAMVLTLIGSNLWAVHGTGANGASGSFYFGGIKALSDTLTQIRLTTVNGTDTFDAGSVNILYE